MSEQTQSPDPEREHSGGDPHHDPTQNAPEAGEPTERESNRERDDDDEDSDDSTS